MTSDKKRYFIVPIPKSPYYRIGPLKWQDWYRQVKKTARIAQKLTQEGGIVTIGILSSFQPRRKSSEIELYISIFNKIAPELTIVSYNETYDTLEQVKRSFEISKEMNAQLIFVSAWMQFPRVKYLAHSRNAEHFGVFGIPSPIYIFVDTLAMVLQPIVMFFGLSNFFHRITVSRREKGTVW